jgi:hypothetical protein
MGSFGDINPNLELAKTILGFTLFVCIFQLIIHGSKGIYAVYKRVFSNSKIAKETDDSLNSSDIEEDVENITFFNYLCTSYLNSLMRFLLAIIYIRSIALVISATHSIFESNHNHDLVLLLMQFFVIFIAGLLWYSASFWIKRFVSCGLFIVSMDVVINILLLFFRYSFIDFELLLSRLILLIIPAVGFLIFNYLFKLQKGK